MRTKLTRPAAALLTAAILSVQAQQLSLLSVSGRRLTVLLPRRHGVASLAL
jgi:hypothetical protein